MERQDPMSVLPLSLKEAPCSSAAATLFHIPTMHQALTSSQPNIYFVVFVSNSSHADRSGPVLIGLHFHGDE